MIGNNNKESNEKKQHPFPKQPSQRQAQAPKQRVERTPVYQETRTMASPEYEKPQEVESTSNEILGSAEEQYNQQLNMLRKDLTSSAIELDEQEQTIVSVKKKSKEQGDRPLSIKHSLTKGGIREAIIMSEVLASPKSLSNQRKRI